MRYWNMLVPGWQRCDATAWRELVGMVRTMKRISLRLVGCAAAAGGALLLSSCAGPSAPVAANHPTSTATVSEPGPFPGHRPGRVQPVPSPKQVVPVPKLTPKPAAPKPAPKPVYKPAAPRPVYKSAPKPVYKTAPKPAPKSAPKPAPAGDPVLYAHMTNITCVMTGGDHYTASFTLVRTGAPSVRINNYKGWGGPYMGAMNINGVYWEVDQDFSAACGQ